MGAIGKVLILVYGAASLMCLMVAAMVYTQKMDFVTPKGEGGKKQVSRVDASIERTKELQRAVNRSYTRWRQEHDDVVRAEIDQFHRREFYRGQIELVRTGQFGTLKVDDPVQELDVDRSTGLLIITRPVGRPSIYVRPPRMGEKGDPGEKAKPMAVYLAGIQKAGEDMKKVQVEIKDLIQKHSDATIVMNGRENPFLKGLRTRVREQERIETDAVDETTFLEDFVTNRRAEAQLFVKRRDSLQARVNELKKYLQKTTPGEPGN